MNDKFFALWAENRLKGKTKFVFSYGFTGSILALVVLVIAEFFIDISTINIISAIAGVAAAGVLLGMILWFRYEYLYQQKIDQNNKRS